MGHSWDTVRGREKADYSWSRLQLLLAAPHTDNPGFWTGREIAELHGVAATPGCAGSGAPGSTWQHLATPGNTWQHLACYSSDKTALLLPINLTIKWNTISHAIVKISCGRNCKEQQAHQVLSIKKSLFQVTLSADYKDGDRGAE